VRELSPPFLADRTTRYAKVFGWMLFALTLFDISLGVIFRNPADPRVEPSKIQRYFDYGRSIEGKLHALVKPDDGRSAPIVVAGWIDKECHRTVANAAGSIGISIFGNSFSGQLADVLSQFVSVESYLGPGAPPNHSYACFVKENSFGGDHNQVQIMGITASSLSRMESIWGTTTSYEYPQPFTFPRYRLGPDGELTSHEPSVRSPDDLRRILSDHTSWNAWLSELEAEDYFYVRGLVAADLADKSVIGRMIRRGFGQSISRKRAAMLRGEDGKINAQEIVKVLPKLISKFAERARGSGQRPIIVLFEEYGQGGVLMRILGDTLVNEQIEYVSSANIVATSDARNYAADGHFSPESNMKIAQALLDLIRAPAAEHGSGPENHSRAE
jgi:hypothetical protein